MMEQTIAEGENGTKDYNDRFGRGKGGKKKVMKGQYEQQGEGMEQISDHDTRRVNERQGGGRNETTGNRRTERTTMRAERKTGEQDGTKDHGAGGANDR